MLHCQDKVRLMQAFDCKHIFISLSSIIVYLSSYHLNTPEKTVQS